MVALIQRLRRKKKWLDVFFSALATVFLSKAVYNFGAAPDVAEAAESVFSSTRDIGSMGGKPISNSSARILAGSSGGDSGDSYGEGYYEATYVVTVTKNTLGQSNWANTGAISKGSGSFVIDHPLDPLHMLLYHSFVESPDVKNMYDGVVTLDTQGEAVVQLPNYFESLNTEYRYQVKPMLEAMPNLFVKRGVEHNSFVISGGVPGKEVSWQVTGIRKDPYILANPIIPEVEKGPGQLVEKGEYLHPTVYESEFLSFSHISGAVSGFFSSFFDFLKK